MALESDPEKEKQWQESLDRLKAAQAFAPPLDPNKLLAPIRQIEQIQQRQAETGRVFPGAPGAPARPAAPTAPTGRAAPAAPRQVQQHKAPVEDLLKPFSGPGSTPARRRFWNTARLAVLSARKLAGRHVSVDEHPGQGSVINVDDTSARRERGAGPPPHPSCPVNVHATLCFRWYPVGFPPDTDCVVTVGEEINIPVHVSPCPIDFSSSGAKFSFSGDLVSATNTGADCSTPRVNPSHFASTTPLSWDAASMQWTIYVKIVFGGWPATFTYGPVIVSGTDLTAVGPITFASDDCPAFCTSSSPCPNPVQSIVIRFS